MRHWQNFHKKVQRSFLRFGLLNFLSEKGKLSFSFLVRHGQHLNKVEVLGHVAHRDDRDGLLPGDHPCRLLVLVLNHDC